jgi:hypothetical protein
MNVATLAVLLLSGDGYWISGQMETVEVQWTAAAAAVEGAVFRWEIRCSGARLAGGHTSLGVDHRAAGIRLDAPSVRAATAAEFVYRIERAADHSLLSEGRSLIHLYPDDLLGGLAARLRGKRLLVWDQPEALPSLLTKSKIAHTAIRGPAELQFTSPDVVLVGSDQLGPDAWQQSSLLHLAAAGTGVLIFQQSRPATLAGYTLIRRAPPARLAWLEHHPLASERALFDGVGKSADRWAIRLPSDEPALEIAWWPAEIVNPRPVPLDVLLLLKAVGHGRLVLCQLPLGPWHSDPRGQLFLATALDYLLSPAQPTPPPIRRGKVVPPSPAEIPTITLPSGG